jgi:bacteriorhodopsin
LEAVIFFGLAQTVGKRSRTFHYFAYILMLVPALGYASIATNFGITEFGAPFGDRCFYTARWLMLLVELPLLVTTAGLMAGVVAFDLSMLAIGTAVIPLAGLLGGLVAGRDRWIFFIIMIMATIPIIRSLWNRFYIREAEAIGFDHEYSALVSSRLTFLCTTLVIYFLTMITFWALAQGANVMAGSTELLILSLADVVFVSSFCISLLSDRETIEKMSEYNARSMGWLRADSTGYGASEYGSTSGTSHAQTGLRA